MKIAVFGRSASSTNIQALQALCKIMLDEQLKVVVYEPFWQMIEEVNHDIICQYELFDNFDEIKQDVDYVFSIGGDGTLLNTVDFVLGTTIPVIGINTGRLGFLAHFNVSDMDDIINAIQNNNFEQDIRHLIKITCNKPLFNGEQFGLNEFTIQKKDPSAIIKVHAYIDGEFLSSYWSDGVIVSTPTGSTGYSLSAGGPIMVPNNNSLVITPIAPHNLNLRPIVIPNSAKLTFKIGEHRGESYCSIDSKYWQIGKDFEFTIEKSEHTINILRPSSTSFMDTLRDKLMWGLDNRNK